MEKFHKTRGPDLGIKNTGLVPPAKAGEELERLIVEQRYAYQFKVETDQKCVKPIITVNGNDADDSRKEMVRQLIEIRKELQEAEFVVEPLAGCTKEEVTS
jgi:predicted metal-binding protein